MGRDSMRLKCAPAAAGLLTIAVTIGAPPAVVFADTAASQIEFGVDMAKRGLWREALFRFQQADRQRPGDAEVLNNIAVCYEAIGLFDKALEAYRKALEASSGNRDLRQNYSRFLEFYQSFQTDEAAGDGGAEAGESDPDEEGAA